MLRAKLWWYLEYRPSPKILFGPILREKIILTKSGEFDMTLYSLIRLRLIGALIFDSSIFKDLISKGFYFVNKTSFFKSLIH